MNAKLLAIIFTIAATVWYTATAYAGHCGPISVNLEDLVDPTGYPAERLAPRPLELDTSLVLLNVQGAFSDLPKGFPEQWKKEGTSISFEQILITGGDVSGSYVLTRFSPPLEACEILAGWDAIEQMIGSMAPRDRFALGNFVNHALLAVTRNGQTEIVGSTVIVRLLPGTDPDTFKNAVLVPLLEALNEQNDHPAALGLIRSWFVTEKGTGEKKFFISTPRMIFPLRVALRLAGYAGRPPSRRAWVSSVEPSFTPLVSLVRTESWMEKLLSDGSTIRMEENENATIEQYGLPGIRLSLAVDILRSDTTGTRLAKLLTNAQEIRREFFRQFTPTLMDTDAETVGPGCIETNVPSPDPRYERTVFSCQFTIFKTADFTVGKIPLRLEVEGAEAPTGFASERVHLLKVVPLSHAAREGIIGVLPLPPVPVFAAARDATHEEIAGSVVHPEDEFFDAPVEKWVKENLRAPVENFFRELIESPRVTIRGKVLRGILWTLAVSAGIYVTFWKWFGVPSLISLARKAGHYGRAVWRACSLFITFQRNRRLGWAYLLSTGSGIPFAEHLSAVALAVRLDVDIPVSGQAFIDCLTLDVSLINRAIAALWLEENHAWRKDPLAPYILDALVEQRKRASATPIRTLIAVRRIQKELSARRVE